MIDPLMLVNATHPLPLDWTPDELVDLWSQHPRHFLLPTRGESLVRTAFEAANELFADAKSAGLADFMLYSCYRDAARQAALWEREPDTGLVARPGQSEHQTGLAMDVTTLHGPIIEEQNAHYREWIAAHCWEHGLIVRYPEGRENVTHIPAEPWHLRFVGREAALEMREHDWVLEEWHEARRPGNGAYSHCLNPTKGHSGRVFAPRCHLVGFGSERIRPSDITPPVSGAPCHLVGLCRSAEHARSGASPTK